MGARRITSFKYFVVISLLLTIFVGARADNKDEHLDEALVGYSNTKSPVIQLEGFEHCDIDDCQQVCGTKDTWKAFCDPKNDKLCMCSTEKFMSSNVEGVIVAVNRENPHEKNCSFACNRRNSYARIWHRSDYSKSCSCLLNQMTKTGITLCDEFALKGFCKTVCKSESASCAFNGVCLCEQSWPDALANKLENVRAELPSDSKDCSRRCQEYHTEYVARIYDSKMDKSDSDKKYEFRDKYCLCGEEPELDDQKVQKKLSDQGFQPCTALKCKMRCGMNMDAICEPTKRRACFCPRNNIFIGKFLWARLPSRKETICVEACLKVGLVPRIIEWNPFYDPRNDRSLTVYRNSRFPYLYDGKFCHCISLKNEPDINQFRPCTKELCQWLCGHVGATCDQKTRRVCICNTHQMAGGLGRKPDPGEFNCNIICRRNLNDARVFEVVWDIPSPNWSVPKAKFCGCIRPVTPAGLTHCDGMEGRDMCPKMCSNPAAFCTKDKVCDCNISPKILENPLVRVPNGKEAIECGEVCRSWTWPLVEDLDREAFIYDESRRECAAAKNCPEVDTTPWTLNQPGALSVQIDALKHDPNALGKYCLCVKHYPVYLKPGIMVPFTLEPPRLSKTLPCIFNYTCIAVGDSLHIVA